MTDSLSIIHHLVEDPAADNDWTREEFYRSSNGDTWQLLRHGASGQLAVRKTPNQASGGAVSTESLETFLAVQSAGPEHEALKVVLTNVQPDGA